jgi:glycosyltransferase involved in cell wall biosynthesis
MTANPKVSVIMIFLDAEAYIEEAIASVFAQTLDDWELLLVDDGSSDRSSSISRGYADAYPGRVRCLTHPGGVNRGMSASRNLGLREARGSCVAFLDSDDVWLPERLERHVLLLEAHPEVAMVYGPSLYWYSWTGDPADPARDYVSDIGVEAGSVVEPPRLMALILNTNGCLAPCICSLTARRDAVVSVGGGEERFAGGYEDQVLIAKICLSFRVMTTGDCLARYRQHPRSFSATTEAGAATYARPDASTRLFLEWLDGYLDARAISDRELRAALERYLCAFRDPPGHALFGKPRQYVRGALKQVLALALPAGCRQRLYARHRRWVVRRSL